jgi:hypothetical protein
MKSLRYMSILILVAALAISVQLRAKGSAGSEEPVFITFDAPGENQTIPEGINSAGAITGNTSFNSAYQHGFVRAPDGTITTFDAPGAGIAGTYSISINSAGEITGWFFDANFVGHGFLRDPKGTITVLDAPGAGTHPFPQGTYAVSINDGGTIAGLFSDSQSMAHGFFRSREGKFTTFDVAPEVGNFTAAASINSAGAITGIFSGKNGVSGGFVRSVDGKFTYFAAPDGASILDQSSDNRPTINAAGTVTGWFTTSGFTVQRGFLRTRDGTFTELTAPVGIAALPQSINQAGEITGFCQNNTAPFSIGFVRRRDGSFVTLNPPGSTFTFPQSINDLGEVAGSYQDASLVIHGFLWAPKRSEH